MRDTSSERKSCGVGEPIEPPRSLADAAVQNIDALVERHECQPVAFFAALKQSVTTQAISETIEELGVMGTVVEWAIRRKIKDLSIADFMHAAELQATRRTGSFLSTGAPL